MGEGKDMIRAVAEKQEEDSKHRFATLLAKVRAENAERRGKKRASDIEKALDKKIGLFVEDNADDKNPHSSEIDSLINTLKSGKNTASVTVPFFYFYGGNGSGTATLFEAIVELSDDNLISGTYATKVKAIDVENVKQVRKIIGEVDESYLEAFDEESMEPAEAGHITLTVKTTDKNRSDVIRDLELVSAAIDKLNLA